MFKFLRKHTKTVIWSVVLAFVLWGGSSVAVTWQKGARFAGEAFGKPVSHGEFDRALKAIQIFTFPDSTQALEESAWQHVVLAREAKNRRLSATDQEVRSEIQRLFAKEDLPFDPEHYRLWVRNIFREEPRFFEEQIRELLLIQKLRDEVLGDANPSLKRNRPTVYLQRWVRDLMTKANVKRYVKFA